MGENCGSLKMFHKNFKLTHFKLISSLVSNLKQFLCGILKSIEIKGDISLRDLLQILLLILSTFKRSD